MVYAKCWWLNAIYQLYAPGLQDIDKNEKMYVFSIGAWVFHRPGKSMLISQKIIKTSTRPKTGPRLSQQSRLRTNENRIAELPRLGQDSNMPPIGSLFISSPCRGVLAVYKCREFYDCTFLFRLNVLWKKTLDHLHASIIFKTSWLL